MSDKRNAMLEIGAVDNTKPAFDSMKANAADANRSVSTSAKEASKAIDGIGKASEQSGNTVAKATGGIASSIKRQVAELQRLRVEQEAGARGTAAYFEALARARGANLDVLRPYIEQLKQSEAAAKAAAGSLDKMGVSARQTAAAMRGVPAQFTDIITALQGGQNPMTVLLQQGGQLKDMFGGVGAAARALGGYIVGLISPLTLTAAAAAGIGAAFALGRNEVAEYAKALAISGNAAGATAGQLQGMAQRLALVAGTQGAAADAVQAVARTGVVAAANIESVAGALSLLSKATGQASSETVKLFEQIAASPAESLAKLSQQYGGVNAKIYEQVRALEEAGDKTKAADLAQKAFADTIRDRSVDVLNNLGLFERGWNAVAGAVKRAVDAGKDIGRTLTPQQQYEALQAQIQERENRLARGGSVTGTFSVPLNPAAQTRLKAEISELQAQAAAIGGVAAAKAFEAEETRKKTVADREAVTAIDRVTKANEQALSKQAQLNKALKEYRDEVAKLPKDSPLRDPSTIAATEAGIRKRFAESPVTIKADPFASEVVKAYAAALNDFGKIAADVAGKTDNLSKTQQRLQQEMASPVFAAYSRQMQEQIIFAASLAQAEEDRAAAIKKANDLANQRAQIRNNLRDSEDAAVRAILESETAAARAAEAAAIESERQAAAYGLTRSAVLQLRLAEKERNLEALSEGSEIYDLRLREIEAIKRQIDAVKGVEVREASDRLEKEIADGGKRAAEQIEQSLTDALMNGGKSGADYIEGLFRTLILRPMLQPFAQAGASAIGTLPTGVGSMGSGLLGSAGSAIGFGNFASGVSTGFASGMTSLGGGIVNGISTIGAGSAAQGIGMILGDPVTIAIAALVLAASQGGETRQGAGYQVNNGVALLGGGPSGGAINRELETRLVQGTFDSINATLKAFGSSVSVAAFQAGLESSEKGRGATFAGGRLSTGANFGQTYDPALYTQSLTPEQAATQFGDKLARVQLEALKAAADTLPDYVRRQLDKLDISALSATDAQAAIASLVALPTVLLQQAGLVREQLIGTFSQGLLAGNAQAAGKTVADQVVAGIEGAMATYASTQIFDIVNQGIIAPVIDSLISGQTIAQAISQASIDKTLERLRETTAALSVIFNDPGLKTGLEELRSLISTGLGGAGDALNFKSSFQLAAAVDPVAAQAVSIADNEAKRLADSLKAIAREGAQLQAQLMELQGNSAGAKAALRALAIEGFTELEIAAYDANEALRAQIKEYDRIAQQRQALVGLISNAYGAADQFLTAAESRAFKLEVLANKLQLAGGAASVPEYVRAFAGISDEGIKSFVQSFLLLPDAAIEAKQAILELGSSLLDISAQNEAAARSVFDRSISAERKLIEARATAARETIAQAEAITQSARNAARDLLGQGTTASFATQQATAFLDSTIQAIKTSGYLPDPAKLGDAISQSVRGLEDQFFATQADADFARVALAGKLNQIGDAGNSQLTIAKAQLKAAEDSASHLDALVDQMSGLNTALVGLPEAIRGLADAMLQRGTLGDIAKAPALAQYIQPIQGPSLTPISTPGPAFPYPLPVAGPDLPPPISTQGPTFPEMASMQADMSDLRQTMKQMLEKQDRGNVYAAITARNSDPNNVQLTENVDAT